MYNSSLKGKNRAPLAVKEFREIPGKVFLNDMSSRNFLHPAFASCDCIYSEPSWSYGFRIFNERSGGSSEGSFADYSANIRRLIDCLNVPAFIIGGKNHKKYFTGASIFPIAIIHDDVVISDGLEYVYVWNFSYDGSIKNTDQLQDFIADRFNKVLDFSCGYGEHMLKFKDFVACDIDRSCLAYLAERVMNG